MAKKSVESASVVEIPSIKMETIQVPIRGLDGPLVSHNWSYKAIEQMLAKQLHKKVKSKEAKNPEEDFRNGLYAATDGTYGFPACGFKAAMVRAAKAVDGLEMTTTRQTIFVVPDCSEDREFELEFADGARFKHSIKTALVRIVGEPQMLMSMVRISRGITDIRFRPAFSPWEAILTIRFVRSRISAQEVVNLVNLAGNTVGVGEGRPERGTDMGWGRFEIVG